MKKNLRYDRAQVKATFDENGFLIDTPIVARIGVQEYTQPDGSVIREFRPAAEVFHADSLASYQGKPITVGHKTVSSKNAKGLMVGSCCGVGFREDIAVRVPVTVLDDDAIEKAKAKQAVELSVGYDAFMINEPGWGSETTGEYILDRDKKDGAGDQVPADWVRFDAVQTCIRVNHVAMVFRGRAGIAKLNIDSNQEFPYDEPVKTKTLEGGKEMVKVKIDGIDYEVPPQVAVHLDKETSRADSAAKEVTALTVERDTLKGKVDGFPAELEKVRNDAAESVKARSALEGILAAHGVTFKADASDIELKKAFVAATSALPLEGKEDAYIDVAFDLAQKSDQSEQQRRELNGGKKPAERGDGADDVIPHPSKQLEKFR